MRFLASALAALVIAAGAPATAGTFTVGGNTVDWPACASPKVTATGATAYSLQCGGCLARATYAGGTVNPDQPLAAGTPVALWLEQCSEAAASVTWSARNCKPPVKGAADAFWSVSESAATEKRCEYSAMVGNVALASVVVRWSGSGAPINCRISSDPASGSSFPVGAPGDIKSMSGDCDAAPADATWNWKRYKNGAAESWTFSGKAPGAQMLPSAPAGSNDQYRYELRVCNANGSACTDASPVTYTVQGSTSTNVGFCGQYPNVRSAEIPYAGAAVATEDNGHLYPDGVFFIKVTVPANATTPLNLPAVWDYAEHGTYMPMVERLVSLSTQPCDFRGYTPGMQWLPAADATGSTAPLAWSVGSQGAVNYLLEGDPGSYAKLKPGSTYYLNIRNVVFSTGQSSCPALYCDMKMMHRPPT